MSRRLLSEVVDFERSDAEVSLDRLASLLADLLLDIGERRAAAEREGAAAE